MANADAHDLGVTLAAGATLVGGLWLGCGGLAIASAATCWVGGHCLSGDIDMGENGHYTPRPVNRLKKMGLWWYWSPFSVFSHRHALTHVPILCTAIKLAWAILPIAVLFHVTGQSDALALWKPPVIGEPPQLTLWGLTLRQVFIGLAVADLTHWIQDGFPIHL